MRAAVRDDAGEITGWVGTATDIEDRKLAEERQRFLAEAGWVLGSSLDYEQTLADVARLAVPHVADWCAVDIFVDGRAAARRARARRPAASVALARELEATMLAASEAAGAQAVRSREAVLVAEVDEQALASFGFDARELEIARALGPRSYVTVPLIARGEVFGSITLVTAESGRIYGEDDLALAQELARHAAAAIDNARLYDEAERRSRAARALEAVGRRRRPRRPGRRHPALERAPRRRSPVWRRTTVLGRRIDEVVQRWDELSPLIPVASKPGEPVRAETVPVEFGGRELWISGSGRRLRGRHGVCVPRPDRGARARGAEGRVRRDRLARAADAAGGDLRLGADDPAPGHRARPGDPASSCSA